MRPSLEAEINELENRIATLENNKIGNLKREHGEIVSAYSKMFHTLRIVNFNKFIMVLKINLMEIKSLKEECCREFSKHQLVLFLQNEMAFCLRKMIKIGREENNIISESNGRLRDKIRLKRKEVDSMISEKRKLLDKMNKVVVQEKNIDVSRCHIRELAKLDIFSPTHGTAGYHPNVLELKKSKIPVLKLPTTSVVETVPFQIPKKPVKVSIPHNRLLLLKKPCNGKIMKPPTGEKKRSSINSNIRLGGKYGQQGKRIINKKSYNNFVVESTNSKLNSHVDESKGVFDHRTALVEHEKNNATPIRSKIPILVANTKSTPRKKEQKPAQNLTPIRSELIPKKKDVAIGNTIKKSYVSVEDAAIAFKTLNDYIDKVNGNCYGQASNIGIGFGEKPTHRRKLMLCSPCIPLKLKPQQKKVSSTNVADNAQKNMYGSVESVYSSSSEERYIDCRTNNSSLVVNTSTSIRETKDDASVLSTSTETGTTVIPAKPYSKVSASGESIDQDGKICESSVCFEKVLSPCFSPFSPQENKAGGDCIQPSIAGVFRYLEYELRTSPETPKTLSSSQCISELEDMEDSSNSSEKMNARRKSEIFQISFNNKKNKADKSDSPSIFKII